MRKVFGIVFYVLAGFFVYMLCLLAFVNQPVMEKLTIVVIFSLLGLVFLFIGLAVNRFQRWRRDVGIVLLSGVGVTASIVFMLACFMMSEEFRKMMPPDTLDLFDGYISGAVVMLGVTGLGFYLLQEGQTSAKQSRAEQTSETASSTASEASDA